MVQQEILPENVHVGGFSCIIFAAQEIIYEGFDVCVGEVGMKIEVTIPVGAGEV